MAPRQLLGHGHRPQRDHVRNRDNWDPRNWIVGSLNWEFRHEQIHGWENDRKSWKMMEKMLETWCFEPWYHGLEWITLVSVYTLIWKKHHLQIMLLGFNLMGFHHLCRVCVFSLGSAYSLISIPNVPKTWDSRPKLGLHLEGRFWSPQEKKSWIFFEMDMDI